MQIFTLVGMILNAEIYESYKESISSKKEYVTRITCIILNLETLYAFTYPWFFVDI